MACQEEAWCVRRKRGVMGGSAACFEKSWHDVRKSEQRQTKTRNKETQRVKRYDIIIKGPRFVTRMKKTTAHGLSQKRILVGGKTCKK